MVEFQNSVRRNKIVVDAAYREKYGFRYEAYRQLWNKAGPDYLPSHPLHVDIEVTDACCLRCTGCFRNPQYKIFDNAVNSGAVFDMGLYDKLTAELEGFTYAINFGFSGECTLEMDLFLEMVQMAHERGFIDKRTNSNAILLDADKIDRILDSELDYFSISVDAASPDTYLSLKGVDKFNHVKRMAELFMRKRLERGQVFPLLRTSFYVCEENRHEVGDFLQQFNHLCDFTDLQGFYKYQGLRATSTAGKTCVYPFKRLGIRANGDVLPCCSLVGQDLVLGDSSESVEALWRCDKINKLRLEMAHDYYCISCARCLSSIQTNLLEGLE